MATYYVRTDGSNSNTGTGPATNQAWATVTYALANMVLTNGTNYLYIAPGAYRGSVTLSITPSSTQTLVISGDPTAAQFSGVASGIVRITNFSSDTVTPSTSTLFTISGKTYTTIQNIQFDFYSGSTSNFCVSAQTNCDYIAINNCVFNCHDGGGAGWTAGAISIGTSTTINSFMVNKCLFTNSYIGVNLVSSAASSTTQNVGVTNCQFLGCDFDIRHEGNGLGRTVYNCTHCFNDRQCITVSTGQTGNTSVYNCLFYRGNTALIGPGMVENYNRFVSINPRTNVSPSGVNSVTGGVAGLDFGYGLLTGIANQQMVSTILNSPNFNFGTTSGAPVSDMYGVTWTGANPDAGSATYRSLSAVGQYNPSERNASTITIAPGSTSQSIELYLGATGLTASTSGLSAYYNRTRTASVSITLVARTIAQAWTAGGFAEVDSTNMPGVYRLDVPDAALAAGADDVTIVVRGASGTNGAVMTVKLSSGGLTSAQTAAAVWDEARSSHVTAGTFGQYVNAELVTPVTSAALVRMGPYEVKADGLGASDPLDIQKGAQHGVDIQCVDVFGSGIDITSATVTAKVYNSGATLVDTYACTATYAADGRATFTIDTTVTDTPGTYTATITRTTGASDTQIFGPLRIYVRDI